MATTAAQWAVVVLIFVFIAAWLFSNWHHVRDAKLTFSMPWLVGSVLLLAAHLEGRALTWHYLTLMIGTAVPLRTATEAWFYSQLGKYLPGKVFLYAGRLYFYLREGRSTGPVSLAIGIELTATISAAILTAFVALLTLEPDGFDRYRWALAGVFAALIAILHPAILSRIVLLAAKILRKRPFAITVGYGQMLGFVGLNVVNWLLFGAAFYAFVRSFYPLGPESIVFLAGAFSAASLVGMMAVFVPAGLGVREGALALFLTRLLPEGLAVATALVARVWLSLVELACVAIIFFVAGAANRLRREELERPRELDESPTSR